MAGPYLFSCGPNHLPAGKINRELARRDIDARLINYTEPNGVKRHWFATSNHGEPFTSGVAREVENMLIDLGYLKEETPEETPTPQDTPMPTPRRTPQENRDRDLKVIQTVYRDAGIDLREPHLRATIEWYGDATARVRITGPHGVRVPWTMHSVANA